MRFILLPLTTLAALVGSRALCAAPPAVPPPAPAPAPAPAPVAVAAVSHSVRVVEATPRAARSLRLLAEVRRSGEPPSVDPAALARRLACWERAGHVKAVQAPRVTAELGERATISVLEALSYVQDFELETTAGPSHTANPVIQTIQEGLVLDVTATLAPGGVSLESAFTWAQVRRPIATFTSTLVPGTPAVQIQIPELKVQRARRRLEVPAGRAVLLADLAAAWPESRAVLAWVEASVVVTRLAPAIAPVVAPGSPAPAPGAHAAR